MAMMKAGSLNSSWKQEASVERNEAREDFLSTVTLNPQTLPLPLLRFGLNIGHPLAVHWGLSSLSPFSGYFLARYLI